LQHAVSLLDNNTPSYLRTHPITSDRIADIENRVNKEPFRLPPDNLDFQLVRTKLIGLQKSPPDAVRYFEDAMNTHKHGNQTAQQYGLVSSLLRNKELDRAKEQLSVLLASPSARHNAMLTTLAGQVKNASHDIDTLDFYRGAVLNFPHHRALVYDYVELLLQNNQAQSAVKLLTEQVTLNPTDTQLYDLQARVYHQLNQPLEQHQAQAYSFAWQGNIGAAIQQLEMAKHAGGNFYQLSTIESDLRELRDMTEDKDKKKNGGSRDQDKK
jgi:predicted Zn-dependent protease